MKIIFVCLFSKLSLSIKSNLLIDSSLITFKISCGKNKENSISKTGISCRSLVVVQYLIEKGAHIEVKAQNQLTPLHWACLKDNLFSYGATLKVSYFLLSFTTNRHVKNNTLYSKSSNITRYIWSMIDLSEC